MEIKRDEQKNENGSYSTTTVTKVTTEDGMVDVDETFNNNYEPKRKWFYGDGTNYQYETDDPKITRPFTILASIFLLLLGIAMLYFGIVKRVRFLFLIGSMTIICTIWFFISSQKKIKEIEKRIKERGKNNE